MRQQKKPGGAHAGREPIRTQRQAQRGEATGQADDGELGSGERVYHGLREEHRRAHHEQCVSHGERVLTDPVDRHHVPRVAVIVVSRRGRHTLDAVRSFT